MRDGSAAMAMKSRRATSICRIAIAFVTAIVLTPRPASAQAPAAAAPVATAAVPTGVVIDAASASAYSRYVPAAAQFALKHGFTMRVIATQRLDWPGGFKRATEKYSP